MEGVGEVSSHPPNPAPLKPPGVTALRRGTAASPPRRARGLGRDGRGARGSQFYAGFNPLLEPRASHQEVGFFPSPARGVSSSGPPVCAGGCETFPPPAATKRPRSPSQQLRGSSLPWQQHPRLPEPQNHP